MEATAARHVMRMANRHRERVRGVRPLFDFDEVRVCGAPRADGGLDLYTANGDGAVGMQATLAWAP